MVHNFFFDERGAFIALEGGVEVGEVLPHLNLAHLLSDHVALLNLALSDDDPKKEQDENDNHVNEKDCAWSEFLPELFNRVARLHKQVAV